MGTTGGPVRALRVDLRSMDLASFTKRKWRAQVNACTPRLDYAASRSVRRSGILASAILSILLLLKLGGSAAAVPSPLGSAKAVSAPTKSVYSRLDTAGSEHPTTFLDRIGWGADAAQLSELKRIGAKRFLDAQLHPQGPRLLPSPIARQLAALAINEPLEQLIPPLARDARSTRQRIRQRMGAGASAAQRSGQQLKALNQRENRLVKQAMARQLLVAIYAQDQLQQRMVWFWMNHFNVFRAGIIGPMMGDYVERVIAPHALGRFRDLLAATLFSPQMLLYLNNAENARGHINENYAREVMELHTIGLPYSQADVTNLAHVLTGFSVDLLGLDVRMPGRGGATWKPALVAFNANRHDPDPEVVLKHTLEGPGLDEIQKAISLLADYPATARHVSFELAQYFVSDNPDPILVNAMVHAWARTGGDIRQVLETMFSSPQFAASLARPQFKDPMRYVISAVRATFEDRVITNPLPLLGMLYRLGEPLYGRRTPDGYPLNAGAWNSPGQLTARFEVAREIGAGAPALFRAPPAWLSAATSRTATAARVPVAAQPHEPPPDLARSRLFVACEPELGRATLAALARAGDRVRWNALWLSSPEFMND